MYLVNKNDKKIQIQIKDKQGKSKSFTVYGMEIEEAYNHIIFMIERLIDSQEDKVIIEHYRQRKKGEGIENG